MVSKCFVSTSSSAAGTDTFFSSLCVWTSRVVGSVCWQALMADQLFRQAKNLLWSNRSRSYLKPRDNIELSAEPSGASLPHRSHCREKGAGLLLCCQSCHFLLSYYWNVVFDYKDCGERSGFKMQSPKNSLMLKLSSVSHRFNRLPELSKFKRKWFSMELNV